MPIRVADYVDFYASLEHATNVGRDLSARLSGCAQSWRHLPLGYHGRAWSIVVSGTPVRRPGGWSRSATSARPARGPSASSASSAGRRLRAIVMRRRGEHLFGVVLLNDWSRATPSASSTCRSARFSARRSPPPCRRGSSRSMRSPSRVALRAQDPAPPPYLRAARPVGCSTSRSRSRSTARSVSGPPARELYWTPAQLLVHLTSRRAPICGQGDLSHGHDQRRRTRTEGSLARDGRGARCLADGDEVVLRGCAGASRSARCVAASNRPR